MPKPVSEHPTELELQILKLLWSESPLTVREVRDRLAANGRDLAHTSVITTLGTMVDKGQLEKHPPREGKAFLFSPRVGHQDVSRKMVGDLVQRVFDGSTEALMQSLLDVSDLDESDVRDLRKLLNKKLRESKS